MAEMWYYTSEGRQMPAVTIAELQRLVADGILKPTDMVWKEGMPRWIRACSVKELYPAVSAEADDGTDRERSRRRRLDGDGDRPGRRRPGASAVGSKFGIVLAVVFGAGVVLLCLGVGVFILIMGSRANQVAVNPKIPAQVDIPNIMAQDPIDIKKGNHADQTKDIPERDILKGDGTILKDLPPNQQHEFKWRVKRGVKASVVVNKELGTPAADIKIVVLKEKGDADIPTEPRQGSNPGVTFTLPASEIVRVIVRNVGKENTIRCTIAYHGGG